MISSVRSVAAAFTALLILHTTAFADGATTVFAVVETGDTIPDAEGAIFTEASAFAFSDNGDALVVGLANTERFYFSRVGRDGILENIYTQLSEFPENVTSIQVPLNRPDRIEYSNSIISFSASYRDPASRSGHFFVDESLGSATVVPDNAISVDFEGTEVFVNETADHNIDNGNIVFYQDGPRATLQDGSRVESAGWMIADQTSASYIANGQTRIDGDPSDAFFEVEGAITDEPVIDGDTIAFYVRKNPPAPRDSIIVRRQGVLSTLVDETTPLPNGIGTFLDFTISPFSLGILLDVDEGDVAFSGHGGSDATGNLQGGVYVARPNGDVERFVGYEEEVPGMAGVRFRDGLIDEIIIKSGVVAFRFITNLVRNDPTVGFFYSYGDGQIVPVIDNSNSVFDRQVLGLSMADFNGDSLLLRLLEAIPGDVVAGIPGSIGTVALIVDFARDRDNDGISDDEEISAGTDPDDANDPRSVEGTSPEVTLFSSVLPSSRSVQVGSTATIFGTILNAGSGQAMGCTVEPVTLLPMDFRFQSTDTVTNAPIGNQNTAVNIAPGGLASFILSFVPNASFPPTDVELSFRCRDSADAPSFPRLNSVNLSARTEPGPDVVALAATATNDGILHISEAGASGAFAVASVNVGSASEVTAQASLTGVAGGVVLSMCQTDPNSGACINPASPTSDPVVVSVAEGGTPTFAVFAQALDAIPLDPAGRRVFVEFRENSTLAGQTSVAVQTDN